MSCEHRNSEVKNSRIPGVSLTADGKYIVPPLPYSCFAYRRRKCLDCGEVFTTVEVPREIMEGYDLKKAKRELIAKLRVFLSEQDSELSDASLTAPQPPLPRRLQPLGRVPESPVVVGIPRDAVGQHLVVMFLRGLVFLVGYLGPVVFVFDGAEHLGGHSESAF